MVGRDSSVGTATPYRLDGTGIESRWVARISTPDQIGPGAHPAFWTLCTGFFPGVKRPERGGDHPPPSSAEVKERVELYLYSPPGPLWPVLGRPLPLPTPTWSEFQIKLYPISTQNGAPNKIISTLTLFSSKSETCTWNTLRCGTVHVQVDNKVCPVLYLQRHLLCSKNARPHLCLQ
jgi:hypothetical protein